MEMEGEQPQAPDVKLHIPGCSALPSIHYYRLLYVQFVATILSSLPLVYESEALFVVYHCNRFLSLEADSLVSRYEAGDDLTIEEDDTVVASPRVRIFYQ